MRQQRRQESSVAYFSATFLKYLCVNQVSQSVLEKYHRCIRHLSLSSLGNAQDLSRTSCQTVAKELDGSIVAKRFLAGQAHHKLRDAGSATA